jgi:hypothetical protein
VCHSDPDGNYQTVHAAQSFFAEEESFCNHAEKFIFQVLLHADCISACHESQMANPMPQKKLLSTGT